MTATITRRTTSRQRWVLVLCAIASLMVALDVTAISTALESIRRGLGASVNELEWTVNAYNLSFAVLLITAAALGDRLGRRRLFAVGMGIFVAASAASALAPNVTVLIAARAVQGVGAALVAPLVAGTAERRLPAGASRLGARAVRGHHRPRRPRRPRDRRRRHAGTRVAVGLLAQRADRAGRDPADPAADRGELRPARAA